MKRVKDQESSLYRFYISLLLLGGSDLGSVEGTVGSLGKTVNTEDGSTDEVGAVTSELLAEGNGRVSRVQSQTDLLGLSLASSAEGSSDSTTNLVVLSLEGGGRDGDGLAEGSRVLAAVQVHQVGGLHRELLTNVCSAQAQLGVGLAGNGEDDVLRDQRESDRGHLVFCFGPSLLVVTIAFIRSKCHHRKEHDQNNNKHHQFKSEI